MHDGFLTIAVVLSGSDADSRAARGIWMAWYMNSKAHQSIVIQVWFWLSTYLDGAGAKVKRTSDVILSTGAGLKAIRGSEANRD
jgi:hypothetical protein